MSDNLKRVICENPFKHISIDANGDVNFCCPDWNGYYSIGNLNETSFSEIWVGEKARIFRKQFFDNNFHICNLNLCVKGEADFFDENVPPPKPKIVIFNYDSSCNQQCIFCRDGKVTSSEIPPYINDEKIDNLLEDLLENADFVTPSTAGECFFSPSSILLIKKIAEKFPQIKFSILTNGLLASRKMFEELKITDRIRHLTVSIHTTNEKTYNKMIRGGNYQKVMENILYISELKKKGLIEHFHLNFVINALNYKEMPDFVKLATKLGAKAQFLELLDTGISCSLYEELNIFDKKHKHHKDFCKRLNNKIFQSENCIMNEYMRSFSKNNILQNLFKLWS